MDAACGSRMVGRAEGRRSGALVDWRSLCLLLLLSLSTAVRTTASVAEEGAFAEGGEGFETPGGVVAAVGGAGEGGNGQGVPGIGGYKGEAEAVGAAATAAVVVTAAGTERESKRRSQDRRRRLGVRGREARERGHRRRLPHITVGTLGEEFKVGEDGASMAGRDQVLSEGTLATPPPWDSTLCMSHWDMPNLQHEVDPNGYLIYVNGREQLGGNKYLLTDGIFVAKSLNRTFVEYPVKDSRVVSIQEESLGLGSYWDLSEMCMYHRILDLPSFRKLVTSGSIPPEHFVTVRSEGGEVVLQHATDEHETRKLFKDFKGVPVLVLDATWKSTYAHDSMQYLRPNPFYMGVVRMLLEEQKDWANGEFMAVQWRTETATGNLTECYGEVRNLVEQERQRLGYERHQVFFNIDLFGKTSGTYTPWRQAEGSQVLDMINEEYPQALDNALHRFFPEINDDGVRAFVSGLAVASSALMIGSSLNDPENKDVPESNVCQKPYSGYIFLITEWRREILQKSDDTVVRLFPFEYPPPESQDGGGRR